MPKSLFKGNTFKNVPYYSIRVHVSSVILKNVAIGQICCSGGDDGTSDVSGMKWSGNKAGSLAVEEGGNVTGWQWKYDGAMSDATMGQFACYGQHGG